MLPFIPSHNALKHAVFTLPINDRYVNSHITDCITYIIFLYCKHAWQIFLQFIYWWSNNFTPCHSNFQPTTTTPVLNRTKILFYSPIHYYSGWPACFEHSNFFKVNVPATNKTQQRDLWMERPKINRGQDRDDIHEWLTNKSALSLLWTWVSCHVLDLESNMIFTNILKC